MGGGMTAKPKAKIRVPSERAIRYSRFRETSLFRPDFGRRRISLVLFGAEFSLSGPSQPLSSREVIAKAIARARSWYDLIVQGKVSGLPDICRQHGLTHRYVKNIFPLAFLGPKSVEFLLNGRDGQARTLDSLIGRVPMRWDEQRAFVWSEP
jgi:hypothetical protein